MTAPEQISLFYTHCHMMRMSWYKEMLATRSNSGGFVHTNKQEQPSNTSWTPLIGYNLGLALIMMDLVSEHFIYALDILVLLLAHIFNRAMSEGFPTSWIEYTIVPIFKSGDLIMLRNHRRIMIGHYLAKLYDTFCMMLVKKGVETWVYEHFHLSANHITWKSNLI